MTSQIHKKRAYKKSWNVFDRLRDNIDFTDTCWLWTASLNNRGYGVTSYKDKDWLAHRLLYVLMVGDVPIGLELDHLCRVRACVNPMHLEAVTGRMNTMRGAAEITHCVQGHEYSAANTYLLFRGGRRCRECHRIESRERRKLRGDIMEGG